MLISISGTLERTAEVLEDHGDPDARAFMVRELLRHLLELRRRTEAGDLAVLDEFFGIWVVEGQTYERAEDPTVARLRAERDRLRLEVVELRGEVPHDFETLDTDLAERRRWRCRRCGHETEAPVHPYFGGCGRSR